MTCRLLAIGECMVELSPRGEDNCAIGFAGDTLNTAWYARQVSSPETLSVAYFSAVGDDELSRRMADFMRAQKIEPALKVIPGATVGLYMIFLANGERSFQYWRSQSAARRLAEDLKELPGLGQGDFAYFSGITLAILPPEGRQVLLDCLKAAAERGVRVVFDPNLRRRLWDSAEDMCAATMAGASVSEIVLPSFEDEAEWFSDADKQATAERYLQAGSRLAVVKDGPGSVLVKAVDSAAFEVAPEPVSNIVDTTAAGDSFNGGFLASLAEGGSLADAVRLGCRLAGQVVTQRGALVEVSAADLNRGA
ncbi:sugar kinase [Roseibium sp. CAU 1637]|uniref:Sugar kinase n=1 Tax=Roseibium limicola TaxID=2816037 RepID=A0A939ELQ7_9HYPH|nr:sugar kinase [Roseibium limicola]MBO0344161.1 sugar kinase [Roseibium limicola]